MAWNPNETIDLGDVRDVQNLWTIYNTENKLRQKKNQPKKQEGGISDWFSTIGGIGGSVAGGVGAGALAGSVVPGLGTAAGAGVGLLGAILGGALGSAGGKVAENAVEGEKDLGKDVAGEALLGGVTSVGPIRGLNVLAKGGKAVAAGAGTKGTLESIGKASMETPIRNAIGNRTGAVADNLAIKGLALSPKAQLGKYQKMYGEDVTDLVKRNNLVGKTADDFDEPISALQNRFSQSVAGVQPVPRTAIEQALAGVYSPLKSSVSLSEQAAGDALERQAQEILKKTGDQVTGADLNKLRQVFDSQVNYNNRIANPANYDVNKRTADALRGVVQDAAPGLKETGLELNKLRTVQEWAQDQANLGRGSKPLGMLNLLGAGGGGAAGGIPGALAGAAVTAAGNSPKVIKGAAKGLEKLSQKAKNANASPLGVGGTLARFGTVGAIQNSMGEPTQAAGSLEDLGITQEEVDAYNAALAAEGRVADPTGEMTGQAEAQAPSNPFGVSLQEVGAQMKNALASGNVKAYEVLADLYDRVYEYEANAGGGKEKPLSAEASKTLANANSGLTSLQQLAGIIEREGVPKGTLLPGRELFGGAGANLAGTAQYDTAAKNITDVITRLRTGAAITENEEKYYKSMLPQAFDSPEVVKQKLGIFQDLFSSISNRTGSSSGSLEEALAAAYQR